MADESSRRCRKSGATGGGRATHAGTDYQNRVAAWLAVQMLAEAGAALPLEIPSGTIVEALRFETDQPVDDVLAETSAGGFLFFQAKHSLSLEKGPESDLASAVGQFVWQYLHARDRIPGALPADRPLDPSRDRLVLVTSTQSSAPIRVDLPGALRVLRESAGPDRGPAMVLPPPDQASRRAYAVLREHVGRAWAAALGAVATEDDARSILELVHVLVLDVESDERDELAARAILGGLLQDAAGSKSAWDATISWCAGRMKSGGRLDLRVLRRLFAGSGFDLAVARSVRADVETLRRRSRATFDRLEQFSKINVGPVDVRIRRRCADVLIAAMREGSLVVVGEPGSGKSALLREAVAAADRDRLDVVYLAADDLAAASLGQLRQELGLEREPADVLREWTGTRPAFLVIDALDAPRSEGPLKTLRELIRDVARLGGRWNVVASIREFDLRWSLDLKQLFAGSSIPEFSIPEFDGVRHLWVPRLDDREIAQVERQAPGLAAMASRLDGTARELLRVPFNLSLLGDLMRGGAGDGELASVRTQVELLDRYWARRVLGEDRRGDARESVLRAASEAMFEARRMWARRDRVSGDVAACDVLRDLLGEGVFVEQPGDRALSYSHHVLHDYAAERLLLRRGGLVPRLASATDACVALRPSLVMHFQRLWTLDAGRRAFWDAVRDVHRGRGVPATAKTTGPAVAAASLRSPSDFEPILSRLESTEEDRPGAVEILAYVVGALIATPDEIRPRTVGPDAQPWCEVLERLSRSMRNDLGPVVAPLLAGFSERSDGMTQSQIRLANSASRRILTFAWARERPAGGLIPVAIKAVFRTYEGDPAASGASIRTALDPRYIAEHGFREMNLLVQEIGRIASIDPALVEDVYRAMFSHEDVGDDVFDVGGSSIFRMSIGRRDLHQSALRTLGEDFDRFCRDAPLQATGALIAVAAALHRRGEEPGPGIRVEEVDGRFVEDGSGWWDDDERSAYEPRIRMLGAFEAMLVHLAGDPSRVDVLRGVLDRVVRENRLAVVWRRLLRAAARAAPTLGAMLRALAWSRPLFACDDTREVAGEFAAAVHPNLPADERRRIEAAILEMLGGAEGPRRRYLERCRDVLLGRLGRDGLVSDEAKCRLAALDAEGGPPRDEPPGGASPQSSPDASSRHWLADHGVPVDEEPNRTLLELQTRAESVGRSLRDAPASVAPDALTILRTLRDELLDRSGGAHPRVESLAWTELAGACAELARARVPAEDPEAADFVLEALLLASRREEPAPSAERDGSYEASGGVEPSPRWNAARGLCILAGSMDRGRAALDAVERLAEDPVAEVRSEVGRCIDALSGVAPEAALKILGRFCRSEESRRALTSALLGSRHLASREADAVEALAMEAFGRAVEGASWDDVRKACVALGFAIDRGRGRFCENAVASAVLADPARYIAPVEPLIRDACRRAVTSEPDHPPSETDRARLRAVEVLTAVAEQALVAARLLAEASASAEGPPPDAIEWAGSYGRAAHWIALHLHFELKKDADPGTMSARHVRFLRDGAGLLDALQEMPYPVVVHYFLQCLEHVIAADPRGVFLRIARAVEAGEAGGYEFESMGAALSMRLVRRFLADHRDVLQTHRDCREALVRILDVFVRAKWPSAFEIASRFEDAFR